MSVPRWLRVCAGVLAVAFAIAIFVQSNSTASSSLLGFLPPGSDKVLHGVAYAVLAALITLASGSPVAGVVGALLYGISDEVHQSFVPGRSADMWDVVADTVGGAIGAYGTRFLARSRRRGSL